MGIPVGWNIVRDEAKEKDVLRADVTGSRSPIRRRARGGRTPRSHASAFDTDALVDASTSPFVEHAPRLSHARTQLPPAPPVPELRERDADGEELRRRSLSFARGHGHGAADSERPQPALTPGFAPAGPRPPDHDMFAPLRQHQRDRRAAEDSNTPRERDDWTRLTAGGRSRRVPSGSGRRIELGDLVQGTPPPPHDYERASLSWTSGRRHAPYARPARRSESQPEDSNPFTAYAAAAAVSHPPLRRVGHRRIADGPLPASSLRESWSPVSTLDGLGDRERSNSVSSTSSNLPWQTFLSTVVPDPVAPTAESSFASAAASASFTASSRASSSNSNSTASEHTHLTVPSRRASPGLRTRPQANESFARACESSDEGDGDGASTASDTEDEAAANPLSRRRMRPSYFADAPPHPRRHGRNVTDAGSDARRYVRSYYADATSHGGLYALDGPHDTVDAPLDTQGDTEESFATIVDDDDDEDNNNTTPAGPASPADRDQELRDARSLLQRLTERGDVGEDFWASVGLTRSFADGVERVQDRGRF